MKKLALCILTVLASSQARAEPTADWYIQRHAKEPKIVEVLVQHTYDGILWSEVYHKDLGGRKLFCPPTKLALNGNQLLDIMRQFLEAHKSSAELPMGLVLVMAVKDTFPCGGTD